MTSIEGKVAIITGASSGIGAATARLLAMHGAKVVLTARRIDRLHTLQKEIAENGGEALVVSLDVTQRKEVEAMAQKVLSAYGHIDILVNNAGLMPLSFIKNLKVDEWDRMIDVNLKGLLYCTAAVLPDMRKNKSGHILNISSIAGRRVFPAGSVYCATKFAVGAFTEGLRQELATTENIRVTAIEPGIVDTELLSTITDDVALAGVSQRKNSVHPLSSEDIANAIYYAISQPAHVNVNELLVMPTQQT